MKIYRYSGIDAVGAADLGLSISKLLNMISLDLNFM
jgi:hypothetical protein